MEDFFFFFFCTDSCLLLVQFYPLFTHTHHHHHHTHQHPPPPHTTHPQPTPPHPRYFFYILTLNFHTWSLPFFSNERKHQRYAYWPFVSRCHRWIPLTKGKQCGKCFNFMMPSWMMPYDYDNHMILRPYYFYYRGFNDYWTSWICIYTLNIHK